MFIMHSLVMRGKGLGRRRRRRRGTACSISHVNWGRPSNSFVDVRRHFSAMTGVVRSDGGEGMLRFSRVTRIFACETFYFECVCLDVSASNGVASWCFGSRPKHSQTLVTRLKDLSSFTRYRIVITGMGSHVAEEVDMLTAKGKYVVC